MRIRSTRQHTGNTIYAFNRATKARDIENKDITLAAANRHTRGIWSNGTTIWAADYADDILYAYTLSTRARDEAKDICLLGRDADNNCLLGGPNRGNRSEEQPSVEGVYQIWSNGTAIWVQDIVTNALLAYTLSDGARDVDKDIILDPNAAFRGIWSDGTHIWAATNYDDNLSAHKLSDGTRDESADFNLGTYLVFVPAFASDDRELLALQPSASLGPVKVYSFKRITPNNAPVFSGTTETREVPENSAADTNVGAVIPEATDADSGDTLTYSMEGTDAASFTFDASARQIQTKTGVTYNHEATKNSYSVTVKADDGNGGTATVVVTITVTDVDEQPATPAKPTLAVVSGSTTSLNATWVKPGLNGGPDITGYNVDYRVSTATVWKTFTHNGTGVTSTITGLTASTSYQVRVQALNGETSSAWSEPSDAVSTNTETTLSSDATLKSLDLSGIPTLNPDFPSVYFSYSASVENSVSSTRVTAIPNHTGARVAITVQSPGSMDPGDDETVILGVGPNLIRVAVTAENGTMKTYYVLVTRAEALADDPLSSDATLRSLSLSGITLDPVFSSGRETYTARVANTVSSTSVTAATTDDGASVAIALGHAVDSDGTVNLEVGPNLITVAVTAANRTTIKTYSRQRPPRGGPADHQRPGPDRERGRPGPRQSDDRRGLPVLGNAVGDKQ